MALTSGKTCHNCGGQKVRTVYEDGVLVECAACGSGYSLRRLTVAAGPTRTIHERTIHERTIHERTVFSNLLSNGGLSRHVLRLVPEGETK